MNREMPKLKDYKTEVDKEFVDKLIDIAFDNDYEIECYEGSLLNNYIIYNTSNIKIGNIKPRQYIILNEKYLNEWLSTTELIMTNDIKTVEQYISYYTNI